MKHARFTVVLGHFRSVVIIYSSFLPLRTGKIVSFTIKRSFSSLHTMSKDGGNRMSPAHLTLKRGVMDHTCTLWDLRNCSMAISVALYLKLSLLLSSYFLFCFVFLVSVTCFWLNHHRYIHFKVKLVGISNYDIVDGKSTPILGLIWSIILRFQVRKDQL